MEPREGMIPEAVRVCVCAKSRMVVSRPHSEAISIAACGPNDEDILPGLLYVALPPSELLVFVTWGD